ncbi:MAG: recombinase family protein [Deltaproteobacteria bacterium]|nr:recombinase family protein [Deltaproteobacteria bacterium]
MNIRTYRRRSKNDDGKQQFSLDVQSRGCDELIARMELTEQPRTDYVDDGRAGDDFLNRSGLRGLIEEAKRGDVIVCAASFGSLVGDTLPIEWRPRRDSNPCYLRERRVS